MSRRRSCTASGRRAARWLNLRGDFRRIGELGGASGHLDGGIRIGPRAIVTSGRRIDVALLIPDTGEKCRDVISDDVPQVSEHERAGRLVGSMPWEREPRTCVSIHDRTCSTKCKRALCREASSVRHVSYPGVPTDASRCVDRSLRVASIARAFTLKGAGRSRSLRAEVPHEWHTPRGRRSLRGTFQLVGRSRRNRSAMYGGQTAHACTSHAVARVRCAKKATVAGGAAHDAGLLASRSIAQRRLAHDSPRRRRRSIGARTFSPLGVGTPRG